MTFGERLQDEAFTPESVNTNKDDGTLGSQEISVYVRNK